MGRHRSGAKSGLTRALNGVLPNPTQVQKHGGNKRLRLRVIAPKPSDTNNVKIRSVELCHNAVCVKNRFRVFLFEGILDHVEGRNDALKLAV